MINYDTILSAAIDYCDAYNTMRRNYPHGLFIYASTPIHSVEAETFRRYEKSERVLYAVCECTNIPVKAALRAARLENRYYNRGGTKWISSEVWVKSQI